MLDKLRPQPGSQRRRKRAGRGPGSGRHKTAGRGVKGQGTRSRVARSFEGGQMPIMRRLPKRGFKSLRRSAFEVLNVRDLGVFGENAQVDVPALERRGLVRRQRRVKLLGDGDAPRKCRVQVHGISAAARAKIEAAGGSVEIIA